MLESKRLHNARLRTKYYNYFRGIFDAAARLADHATEIVEKSLTLIAEKWCMNKKNSLCRKHMREQ